MAQPLIADFQIGRLDAEINKRLLLITLICVNHHF